MNILCKPRAPQRTFFVAHFNAVSQGAEARRSPPLQQQLTNKSSPHRLGPQPPGTRRCASQRSTAVHSRAKAPFCPLFLAGTGRGDVRAGCLCDRSHGGNFQDPQGKRRSSGAKRAHWHDATIAAARAACPSSRRRASVSTKLLPGQLCLAANCLERKPAAQPANGAGAQRCCLPAAAPLLAAAGRRRRRLLC